MSRRIEVELTSNNEQGLWTWRAVGAREPRGTVSAERLYEGVKVGDVVRAEADFGIDGIALLSVTPPKQKATRQPESRLELKGSDKPLQPVTTTLAGRPRREGRRPERGDRPARPRRDAKGGPGRGTREAAPSAQRSAPQGGPKPAAPKRQPAKAATPPPFRLSPANTHRSAALGSLPEEQKPIGEQLLRGGIPAVRQAIQAQNAEAAAKGTPAVPEDQVISLAESLLPKLNAAAWRDRAEAATKHSDKVSLRDLRAIVSAADVARDEESRDLAANLRSLLEQRVAKAKEDWLAEIETLLAEGRVVRALRISARPPSPGDRFPSEMSSRLAEATSEAMSPEADPDRWAALLEATAASPVRRAVRPAGLPKDAPEALVSQAKQLSARVPALAGMLGIDMPPPPGPPKPKGGQPKPPSRPRQPAPEPDAGQGAGPASETTDAGPGDEKAD